jgi:hypothetical protein
MFTVSLLSVNRLLRGPFAHTLDFNRAKRLAQMFGVNWQLYLVEQSIECQSEQAVKQSAFVFNFQKTNFYCSREL